MTDETEWRDDGETWESYARRLEVIIQNQRENLRMMQKLENQGNRGSRKRVALLERALGQSEAAAFRRKEQRQNMHERLQGARVEIERLKDELDDERARVVRLRNVLTPPTEEI